MMDPYKACLALAAQSVAQAAWLRMWEFDWLAREAEAQADAWRARALIWEKTQKEPKDD